MKPSPTPSTLSASELAAAHARDLEALSRAWRLAKETHGHIDRLRVRLAAQEEEIRRRRGRERARERRAVGSEGQGVLAVEEVA